MAGGRGTRKCSFTIVSCPDSVIVDQLGSVYIADRYNHRIVRWKKGATAGEVLAGGNGARLSVGPTQSANRFVCSTGREISLSLIFRQSSSSEI